MKFDVLISVDMLDAPREVKARSKKAARRKIAKWLAKNWVRVSLRDK